MAKLAQYWKALPAVAGVIAQLIALGLLTGSALHYAQIILSVLTAIGVVAAPKNAPKPV